MTTTNSRMPVYDPAQVSGLLPNSPANPRPEPMEGFLTFWDPGLSILHLRDAMKDQGTIFYPQDWYEDEKYEFARKGDLPQWRQLRMEPVPGSLGKRFAEQQALLPDGEEVPAARVVVMGAVLHFLATGERLFPDCYVRTSDVIARGYHVYGGLFDAARLYVGSYWGLRPQRRCRAGVRPEVLILVPSETCVSLDSWPLGRNTFRAAHCAARVLGMPLIRCAACRQAILLQ